MESHLIAAYKSLESAKSSPEMANFPNTVPEAISSMQATIKAFLLELAYKDAAAAVELELK